MPLSLLSLFLSFFINLFFLTILLISLTLPVKKEEIKITLLEEKSLEIFQQAPKKEEVLPTSPPLEKKPYSEKAFPQKAPPLRKIESAPFHKRESLKPKEEPLSEDLIKKRLSQLEERASSKKEADLLKERLSQIEKKVSQKGEALNEKNPSKGMKEPPDSSQYRSYEKATLSSEHLSLIRRKLQNHFEIPIYLRDKKDLSVIVEIEIGPDGSIKRITYLKKSRDDTFNKAVERCLAASNPLPVEGPLRLKVEFQGQGSLKFN